MSAQTFQRKATLVNGGSRDRGQCTVEVSVDGAAEVEIRGSSGTLRNTSGQPAQWRRFECTAPMPPNPLNLTFEGTAGRGRQSLVRDPRNGGGPAVVQIEDSQDGADVFSFALYWGDRRDAGPPTGFNQPFEGPGPPDRGRPRFTEAQAVQVCQDSIRAQAIDRFRTRNIDFRTTSMDDKPGGRDRVLGELAVRRSFGRQSFYHFACSVNFDTGEVRNARIDQFESAYYPEYKR